MTPAEPCPKSGYPSRQTAERYITKRIRDNRTLDLRPYLCPFCGLWHITHQPERHPRRVNHD